MASISSHSTSLPKPALVAAELVGLSTPGIVLRTSYAKDSFGHDVTELPSVKTKLDNVVTTFGDKVKSREGYSLIGDGWSVTMLLSKGDTFTPSDSALRTTEGGPLKPLALTSFFIGDRPPITAQFSNPSSPDSALYRANALIGRALQSLYGKGPQNGDPSYRSAFNRYCQEQFPNLTELLSDPKIPLESRNSILDEAMRTLAEPFPDIANRWLAPVVNMIKSQ